MIRNLPQPELVPHNLLHQLDIALPVTDIDSLQCSPKLYFLARAVGVAVGRR